MPLLSRIPLAPIVTAYLTNSALLHEEERNSLNQYVTRCLVILWPSASLKFSPDVLLGCFGALLTYLATVKKEADHCIGIDPHVARIGALIVPSYRIAYGNAANKKKVRRTCIVATITDTTIHRFALRFCKTTSFIGYSAAGRTTFGAIRKARWRSRSLPQALILYSIQISCGVSTIASVTLR